MNINRENANNSKDDDYTFVIHSYMWNINLGTTRHMTVHRVVFDTYGVIILVNVHLSNDSTVEVIEIKSIIFEVLLMCETKRICIKIVFHVLKLHACFLSREANLFLAKQIMSNGRGEQLSLWELHIQMFVIPSRQYP